MEQTEAEAEFSRASALYIDGRYEEALVILSALDAEFPGTLNILKAKTRTLAKLGRVDEAVALCDRLASEFGYDKAVSMRERLLVGHAVASSHQFAPVFDGSGQEDGDASADAAPRKSRFRIKPIRLLLVILIVAGMYFGYVNYWIGGGLIAGYFVMKFVLRKLLYRLFTLPFRMKGKALSGATTELHGFTWTVKPQSAEPDDDDDEDEGETEKRPLRYVWLDVSITPQVRTQGFRHWEPGELMLAPLGMKIRSLDDMDKCYRVEDVRFVENGKETEDEGFKVNGPSRLRILAGVPESEQAFKFVYYGESFGEMRLS